MKEIKLNGGKISKVALVDDEDFDRLNEFNWHLREDGYVSRMTKKKNGNRKHLLMHRAIMNITESNVFVDHKDHNKLNNIRTNLRVCNRTENARNMNSFKGSSSKYSGVHFIKRQKQYSAHIRINGKKIHLGTYNNERIAAVRYNLEAVKLFGEFANLNKTRE